MRLIDSHSHIYLEEFDTDRSQVIQTAKQSGISAVLLPNVDVTTLDPLFRICDQYPDFVFPMMGLHPTSVNGSYASQLNRIEKMLTSRNYCGIGEIGIDLFWSQQHIKEQKEVFEEQLRWSIRMQLPVSIHTRNAFPEVFDSIYKVGDPSLKGVFHCFSGTVTDLEEIKRLANFKIGIDGNITYKKSPLVEILQYTPLEMILLETDAPYLAPVPYRGKRNEPANLWETARKTAEIFQLSLEEVAHQTWKNTMEMFQIL
ncbi:MAG: TatD family hydrolase [Tannerella sp.]|jgi:TatD DNase family protein|nr:TatD family hydrolase [Tannerella sp.]